MHQLPIPGRILGGTYLTTSRISCGVVCKAPDLLRHLASSERSIHLKLRKIITTEEFENAAKSPSDAQVKYDFAHKLNRYYALCFTKINPILSLFHATFAIKHALPFKSFDEKKHAILP